MQLVLEIIILLQEGLSHCRFLWLVKKLLSTLEKYFPMNSIMTFQIFDSHHNICSLNLSYVFSKLPEDN